MRLQRAVFLLRSVYAEDFSMNNLIHFFLLPII